MRGGKRLGFGQCVLPIHALGGVFGRFATQRGEVGDRGVGRHLPVRVQLGGMLIEPTHLPILGLLPRGFFAGEQLAFGGPVQQRCQLAEPPSDLVDVPTEPLVDFLNLLLGFRVGGSALPKPLEIVPGGQGVLARGGGGLLLKQQASVVFPDPLDEGLPLLGSLVSLADHPGRVPEAVDQLVEVLVLALQVDAEPIADLADQVLAGRVVRTVRLGGRLRIGRWIGIGIRCRIGLRPRIRGRAGIGRWPGIRSGARIRFRAGIGDAGHLGKSTSRHKRFLENTGSREPASFERCGKSAAASVALGV